MGKERWMDIMWKKTLQKCVIRPLRLYYPTRKSTNNLKYNADTQFLDSSVQKYKAKRRFSYDALPNLQLKLEEVRETAEKVFSGLATKKK